jgi:glutamate/tyrosine decarboxylase-like PLP-dependent enzyme
MNDNDDNKDSYWRSGDGQQTHVKFMQTGEPSTTVCAWLDKEGQKKLLEAIEKEREALAGDKPTHKRLSITFTHHSHRTAVYWEGDLVYETAN